MTPLPSRLKALAARRGLSNAEVARRCDIGERTYAGYCSGSREPDLVTLLRICSRMNVTPNDLLLDQEDDKTERESLAQQIDSALSLLSVGDLKVVIAALDAIAATRHKNETSNE